MGAKRSGRRKLTRPQLALAIGAVAIIAGIGIFFAIRLGGASDLNFAVRGAVPLADGGILLVERAGMADNTYDRGRLRVVTREGAELRRSGAVKSALVFHGVVADHVWVTSHERGLEAWRLADLAPARGASAISQHAMLSRKRNVVGVTDQALVVRAADDRLYAITNAYAIAKHPKDAPYRAVAARSGSVDMLPLVPEDGRGHVRAGQSVRDVDLVRPRAELDLAPDSPPDTAAVLVHSIDFEGQANSAMVSRVEAGVVKWSVAARDVIGKHDLGANASFTFKLAELRDGTLWLVAEAGVWYAPRSDSRSGSRGHGEYVHQIASVDPATGAIRSSHRIK